MTETDREYYSRRREECLTLANRATDVGVARVHRDLAARYGKLLEPAGDAIAT
jgi:hypothetical protein